jgi:hypothetical protein
LPATWRSNGIGSYLARVAYLEAASVPAFERLGRELEGLGAPRELSRLCRRAAEDERRHASVMDRLAAAHGVRPRRVELDAVPPRDAVTIAIENAVEGCVRETFGAAVGLHQAWGARDLTLRQAMGSIAQDEIRHAALSWKIAAWIEPTLSARNAERVAQARARAVASLAREVAFELPWDVCATLGLPNGAARRRMAGQLARTVWLPPRHADSRLGWSPGGYGNQVGRSEPRPSSQ